MLLLRPTGAVARKNICRPLIAIKANIVSVCAHDNQVVGDGDAITELIYGGAI